MERGRERKQHAKANKILSLKDNGISRDFLEEIDAKNETKKKRRENFIRKYQSFNRKITGKAMLPERVSNWRSVLKMHAERYDNVNCQIKETLFGTHKHTHTAMV